jgi:hypothetical protein
VAALFYSRDPERYLKEAARAALDGQVIPLPHELTPTS